MAQIKTKFIENLAVTAIKLGSDAATLDQALFADGSGGASYRSILSSDIPTLNQNTTGTAANITASSNSTLTTLSALTTAGSLAISGSQVSGGTFGIINGSALTNLAAANISGVLPVGVTGGSGLSIATSQITGSITAAQMLALPSANIYVGNGSNQPAAVAMSGEAIISNTGAVTLSNAAIIAKVLTGYTSGAGTISASDSILSAIEKLNGNIAAAGGTVTSVAFSDASTTPIYSISGSPVTSSGTLTQTLTTQSANTVFAGPTTGSAAQPTFRSLVAADIPSLSATYVTQSEVGAANGVASLDSGGKIPVGQLPNGVFVYQGLYDPSTNTPILADGVGVTGQVYYVDTAFNGVVTGAFGGASLNFSVGDLAIYNGTQWELTTPAAGVSSVNGAYGAVIMSMVSANGFAGTYSGTALTVSTTVTGILQGNGTAISAASTTGSGAVVLATSPTLVTPALGTPSALVGTNITGTAAGFTAGTVTTNANMTGDVTSVGNATSLVATSNATLTTLSALTTASSLSSVGTITSGTWNGTAIAIAHGGTGQTTANAAFNALSPMTTAGDIIYENATPIAARLGIGSTGQVLTVIAGLPAWSNAAATTTNGKETFVLSGTDITNQFVTLSHTPLANSTDLLVQGAGDQLEGASYDYTVSGATIVFQNGLATGGVSALVAGDIIQVQYEY